MLKGYRRSRHSTLRQTGQGPNTLAKCRQRACQGPNALLASAGSISESMMMVILGLILGLILGVISGLIMVELWWDCGGIMMELWWNYGRIMMELW